MRHRIEHLLFFGLLGTSLAFAYLRVWPAATYFVALAALVDFDDWMHVG